MKSIKYLALLRGINVGGNNIIRMADLKSGFEDMGFSDVKTYIQSGNVIFKSDEKNKSVIIHKIETELSQRFSYKSKIVVISHEQLETVVSNAPEGYGKQPEEFKYDVLFLKEPLTADEAFQSIKVREGVDFVSAGKDVLYFSRLISKAGQSYLNQVISLPIYKQMTIRNWNTTSKLLNLMNF